MSAIPGLSVIVIARNEEVDLPACLASVREIASEIVLVDSGSTDRTVEIARAAGARILTRPWDGYGRQKQFALENASGPWVLNIDADERVTPALAAEIRGVLASQTGIQGFSIPFRHFFLGKHLRFGRFTTERHLRLFRKDAARYGEQQIHEGIRVQPPLAELREPIDHHSYRDLNEYLEKCNRYTSMIAEKRYAEGKRFSVFHHLRLPSEFFMRYVVRLGFLDGEAGLTYSLLSSYYVWMKFLKLRDLERK